MLLFATARDGADVDLTSYQEIDQQNICDGSQICANDGTVTNLVFASGTNTDLNGDTTQILTQTCDGTSKSDGWTCFNDNTLTINTQALNNALLTYNLDQNVQNTNEQNQGSSTFNVGQSGGSFTYDPATQTNPPQTTNAGNLPPT
jgi:hypothetical protein